MDNTFLTLGLFLIALGFVLVIVDLFLTSGVLLVLALGCILVGLTFLFKHDMEHRTNIGFQALAVLIVAVPLTVWLMFKLGPMGRMAHAEQVDETVATMPVHKELEHLRGRFGRTISSLRPAGVVDFEGRRVDALSEGMMIEPGQWVRCLDVQAGKVIVRRADKPDLKDLEANLF